jgi:hypothetical protein
MSRFVLTLPLQTEKYQEDILNTRFEIGRQIYNAVLNVTIKRYNEMIKTKVYRENQEKILKNYPDKKKCKPYYSIKNDLITQYRLNEYSLHEDVKEMQHHFKSNIDSFTAQKIASRVWGAIETNLFGKGETIHFKSYNNGLDSLEGKSNSTGIVYKLESNILKWNGLEIPVKLDISNYYEISALSNKICFCRIKRKFVRDKYKYYLQLILDGTPPLKVNKDGEIKRYLGIGTVGLDIGTQSIAISSNTDVKLLELADRVNNIEKEKRRLLRYMDRSKRANNPNNFNENGTIKKQGNKKVKWIKSNKYIKTQNQLKELYRKQADIRAYQHNLLSSYIISLGDTIKVEEMNYKGLQSRSKKTEKNDNGKFKNKKRFGKSLTNKAPAKLLTIIKNKLDALGGTYIEVNTKKVKASQYNHLNGEYNKKKLSQRWNDFDGIKVQRDLYSAFLIQHVDNDLCSINQEQCKNDFDSFMILHDKEIERLSNIKLRSALKNVI